MLAADSEPQQQLCVSIRPEPVYYLSYRTDRSVTFIKLALPASDLAIF
jgi:hypothetical protein